MGITVKQIPADTAGESPKKRHEESKPQDFFDFFGSQQPENHSLKKSMTMPMQD